MDNILKISERIGHVFESKGISHKKFCDMSGVNYRTLRNYIDGRMPSAEFLISIHETLEVSIDWLLTGKGHMYYNAELLGNYLKDTETQPLELSESDAEEYKFPINARAHRLNAYINEYMATHSDDEQAWLEIDFKNHYKDYSDWLDKKK